MDLTDYLRVLRKNVWLIVLCTLVGGLLAAGVSALLPQQFVARTQMFVSTQGQSSDQLLQGSNFTQQRVKSYAEAISTPLVLQPVIDDLDLVVGPDELSRSLAVSVPLDTVLIELEVEDEDPARAAEVANAVSEQFRDVVPTLENSSVSSSPVRVTILRSAVPPERPDSPDLVLNTAVGLVLGLVIGLGLALLRQLTDTVIRSDTDVKDVTDRVIIGGLQFHKETRTTPLIVHGDPLSPRAEAFRTLRTNLQFVDAAHHASSLVLTSSVPGEGKSTTTANLALAIAEGGARVCVVEADLRRPRMAQYLGLISDAGLTNLLIGEAGYEDVLQPFGDGDVTVLGSGPIPPNPSELLGSPAMRQVVADLAQQFDYVIYDAPPVLPVTDAAVLAKQVGAVVVVVGAGVVRKEQLRRTLELLDTVGADVLGMVLNRLPTKGADSYTYYKDSYRPDPVDNPDAPRSARRSQERRSGRLGSFPGARRSRP
ncbi:MAG TPA: polysaccharide biosynthesis tyrosine autokinase [Ornithinimicrobium sp.]|nr:polysaccharide biosynthesis tyrosine autokinase [Ornithinimicrobium sp.]